MVFGTRLAIEQVLGACGWTINTAFVDRLNLDLRQRVAAIGRRVNTLCQGEAGLRDQLGCSRRTTTLWCPMRAYASPYGYPKPPIARDLPGYGGRVHRRWQQA